VVNVLSFPEIPACARRDRVHAGFVARLASALPAANRERLLVHLSIPGDDEDDGTPFSTTKRRAEHIIAGSGVPHIILRPGFVVAPAAYGGSALIRPLASLPFDLPKSEASRPFAAIDAADIGRTLAVVARRWGDGVREWRARWAVMERHAGTVGEVIGAFRRHLGGPGPMVRAAGPADADRRGGRRPLRLDRRDRYRARDAGADIAEPALHRAGTLVRPALSAQALADRRAGAVLNRFRADCPGRRIRRGRRDPDRAGISGMAGPGSPRS